MCVCELERLLARTLFVYVCTFLYVRMRNELQRFHAMYTERCAHRREYLILPLPRFSSRRRRFACVLESTSSAGCARRCTMTTPKGCCSTGQRPHRCPVRATPGKGRRAHVQATHLSRRSRAAVAEGGQDAPHHVQTDEGHQHQEPPRQIRVRCEDLGCEGDLVHVQVKPAGQGTTAPKRGCHATRDAGARGPGAARATHSWSVPSSVPCKMEL